MLEGIGLGWAGPTFSTACLSQGAHPRSPPARIRRTGRDPVRGMIQLAWRFLLHQKESALAQWYRARTADARGGTRKTLIVALARKLLIALWRLVTTGEMPEGVVLRPAA